MLIVGHEVEKRRDTRGGEVEDIIDLGLTSLLLGGILDLENVIVGSVPGTTRTWTDTNSNRVGNGSVNLASLSESSSKGTTVGKDSEE